MKLVSLVEPGDPERLATGFQFTEGPVWMPDGYLLFSDIPANRIFKWTPDGQVEVWQEPSGNSNGLTIDPQNRLVVCEQGNRRVSRIEGDGAVVILADRYQGRLLNSPNDVVVKSDGTIYFSDPPYGIIPGESSRYRKEQEQPWNGLYRILPDGGVELLVDDFDRPNGLAFSPDESMLYVDDTPRRHVRAFDVQPDGTLTNSRIIADMAHPQPGGPDGMKIDVEGHLYVTGATGIWVFEPDGTWLGVIVTPERPANLAWGDSDRKTLYITARTSLYRIRVKVPGLPAVRVV
jgi:gluconolactonase